MSASAVRGGKVAIEIGADVKRFYKALDAMAGRVRALGSQLSGIGAKVMGIGLGGAAPFAAAIAQTATFEDTVAALGAVAEAQGPQLEALRKKAMDLGASTSFTAQQVAEGMQALAQGGFTVEETLAGVEGTLLLARAGMLDLGAASGIAVSVLRSFKMEAADTGKVADILAMAANASNANVEGLGEALSTIGGIAYTAGASLTEVTAAIGLLADRGMAGSEAGTALRRVLIGLSQEQEALRGMGVEVKDPNTGKLKPLKVILDEIKRAMAGMDETDRIAKLSKIFDVFGANAVLQLMNAGDALGDLDERLQDAGGSAAEVAKKMDDTLGGSFRMFASAAEAAGLQVGAALSGPLREVIDLFTRLAAGIADWASRNQEAVVSIAKVVAYVVAAGASLLALGTSVHVASFAFSGLAAAVSLAIKPLSIATASVQLIARSFTNASGFVLAVGSSMTKAVAGIVAFSAQAAAVATQYAASLAVMVASTAASAISIGASWAGAAITGAAAYLAHIKALITYYTGALAGIVAITITRTGQIAGAWVASAGAGIAAFVRSTATAAAAYVGTLASVVAASVSSAAATAAAWLAPIAPFLAIGAAVAGLGTALQATLGKSGKIASNIGGMLEPLRGGFNAVLADATKVFGDLYGVANTTFAGISDAIQAGDMALAFEVLWAGVQAAWLRGQAAIMSYVDPWIQTLQNIWGSMTAYLAVAITKGLGLAERGWVLFSSTMVTVWQASVNKVLDVWDSAIGAIQKAIAYIRSFFDKSIDYDAVRKQIDNANRQRKADRDRSLQGQREQAQQRDEDIQQRTQDTVEIILDDDRRAQDQRQQRTEQRAAQREQDIQAVNDRLATTRERAAATKEGSDIARNAGQAGSLDELRAMWQRAKELADAGLISNELLARIEQAIDDQTLEIDKQEKLKAQEEARKANAEADANNAAAGVAQEMQKGDVAGTFSAAAVRGLGFSSNLAERTARACEGIEKNTKDKPGQPKVQR